MRALETQLLFGSSEAVLLKCSGTSQNLVSAPFPMLKLAVEKNKPALAKNYLEKARIWIEEIIQDVNQIIERYDLLNKNVALSTLDIKAEKTEMEKKSTQLLQENEEITKTLKTLEEMLDETNEKLTEAEKSIGDKNLELQNLVKHSIWERFGSSCCKGVQIFRAQSRDAYRFLEFDPSSLSEEEWQKEYTRVKNQLREIKVFSGEYNSNQITQAE
ncbi:hypothetical protein SRHO_G00075590 [Serrasalmus rhombeus]